MFFFKWWSCAQPTLTRLVWVGTRGTNYCNVSDTVNERQDKKPNRWKHLDIVYNDHRSSHHNLKFRRTLPLSCNLKNLFTRVLTWRSRTFECWLFKARCSGHCFSVVDVGGAVDESLSSVDNISPKTRCWPTSLVHICCHVIIGYWQQVTWL